MNKLVLRQTIESLKKEGVRYLSAAFLLEGLLNRNPAPGEKRILSVSARKRISDAQKFRWAKFKTVKDVRKMSGLITVTGRRKAA